MTGLALVVTSYSEVINDRVGSENSTFAPLTAYLQSPWISAYDANGRLTRLPGFIPNVVAIETFDTNQSKTTRALVTYLQNFRF
jgi:hypothetical protein